MEDVDRNSVVVILDLLQVETMIDQACFSNTSLCNQNDILLIGNALQQEFRFLLPITEILSRNAVCQIKWINLHNANIAII